VKRKDIPVQKSFAKWRKDPGYRAAYDALEEEFSLAEALLAARTGAAISQEEIAKRMRTSQPAIARLEGGRANPSLDTLRRYARATGTRLKVTFEREGAKPRRAAKL
jgi:ribosome-binding protein aMBF1 (putative translation factor)